MAHHPRPKSASDLGEDQLIAHLTRNLPQTKRTIVGPGSDDCAVIQCGKVWQLFKTDCLVESIHFNMETAPERVGWKALCRCLSDIAASGGDPGEALITLAMPQQTPLMWIDGLYRGLKKAARKYGVGIAGGETTSLPVGAPIVISIAMLGIVEKKRLTLRSGGRPSDILCVTGRLGGSISGWHLDFTPRLAESRWLTTHCKPSAMMDLSDGLAVDLPRLANASQCDYEIDLPSIPRHRGLDLLQALGDGEDYELLCALPPAKFTRAVAGWPFSKIPLTPIGRLTAFGSGRTPMSGGWDHFSGR